MMVLFTANLNGAWDWEEVLDFSEEAGVVSEIRDLRIEFWECLLDCNSFRSDKASGSNGGLDVRLWRCSMLVFASGRRFLRLQERSHTP